MLDLTPTASPRCTAGCENEKRIHSVPDREQNEHDWLSL